MKIETIYNRLNEILKYDEYTRNNMLLELKQDLEQIIREETCYKSTSKTRVNAIKRICKRGGKTKKYLNYYDIQENMQVFTDSYIAFALYQDNMPVEKCNDIVYPNVYKLINRGNKYNPDTDLVELNYNDILAFYKLNKSEKKPTYQVNNAYYDISYLKDAIDILGTNLKVYIRCDDTRTPMYLENAKGEMGIIMPVVKY